MRLTWKVLGLNTAMTAMVFLGVIAFAQRPLVASISQASQPWVDSVIFNDTSIYQTIQPFYEQNLSPHPDAGTFVTEIGSIQSSSRVMQSQQVLTLMGHDINFSQTPNLNDAILLMSVSGSELSQSDTEKGRLTVTYQRESSLQTIPQRMLSLRITFVIRTNTNPLREKIVVQNQDASITPLAKIDFYLDQVGTSPSSTHWIQNEEAMLEITFQDIQPMSFVFAAMNGSHVTINDIAIEFTV